MLFTDVIRKKRDGGELSDDEIQFFVDGLADNSLPAEQVSSLAMAIFLNSMTFEEAATLTLAMASSGTVLDWSSEGLDGPVVDKHSTGGVGDKVSFLLVVQGRVAALSDGAMTIQAPPNAVLFSDRPARRVLPVNLKTFTDALWGADGSMRRSPPNASIVDENAEEIGVIELNNVSYSGDKLQVHFKMLGGKMPTVGQTVAMTVDGVQCPPIVNPRCTD